MQIDQNLRPTSNAKSIAFRHENSLTDDQWKSFISILYALKKKNK